MPLALILLPMGMALSLAGCGSDDTHDRTVIVVPQGSKVVCADGSAPPCPTE
ncbi:hypothetical protein [Novacetimonas cocois]|uniref:hypothetical protein n=1 Tax=Novacetimonas cocois TaxID=1747507 RepID=UPI001402AA30|nr:hypothetical protein [Novacetimonas cocois]